jgi:hypothetical protein
MPPGLCKIRSAGRDPFEPPFSSHVGTDQTNTKGGHPSRKITREDAAQEVGRTQSARVTSSGVPTLARTEWQYA